MSGVTGAEPPIGMLPIGSDCAQALAANKKIASLTGSASSSRRARPA